MSTIKIKRNIRMFNVVWRHWLQTGSSMENERLETVHFWIRCVHLECSMLNSNPFKMGYCNTICWYRHSASTTERAELRLTHEDIYKMTQSSHSPHSFNGLRINSMKTIWLLSNAKTLLHSIPQAIYSSTINRPLMTANKLNEVVPNDFFHWISNLVIIKMVDIKIVNTASRLYLLYITNTHSIVSG